MNNAKATSSRKGFTLVELLVVMGIIALLMGMLLPSLSRARQYALKVNCASNMRQVYIELQLYADANRGWLFPRRDVAPWTFGYVGPNTDPNQVWTTMVFGRTDPPVMVCPTDLGQFPTHDDNGIEINPLFWHSYVINNHLADYKVKVSAQGSQLGYKSQSEVILMGEKYAYKMDYFMEQAKFEDGTPNPAAAGDYHQLVDQFKHGLTHGSNYLYMDGHVDNDSAEGALRSLDPWDFYNRSQAGQN
jgi:prepilin-type N-terminal cleavage/methylation domain-containing protein/prepilin-type processing-associated H-X9-DG protein